MQGYVGVRSERGDLRCALILLQRIDASYRFWPDRLTSACVREYDALHGEG